MEGSESSRTQKLQVQNTGRRPDDQTNIKGGECIWRWLHLYSIIWEDRGPHEDVDGERKILHFRPIQGNTGKLEFRRGSAQFYSEELKTLFH
jgi:hypothetical protein